jgi:hypothetical protein
MSTPPFLNSTVGSVVALYWPSLDPTTMRQWATDHQGQATQLIGAANASELTYQPLFPELLQGQTGHALETSLAKNMNLWRSAAVEHQAATTALDSAADYLQGLQTDLENIVDHYQPLYEAATTNFNVAEQHGDTADAQFYANQAAGYVTKAQSEAKPKLRLLR